MKKFILILLFLNPLITLAQKSYQTPLNQEIGKAYDNGSLYFTSEMGSSRVVLEGPQTDKKSGAMGVQIYNDTPGRINFNPTDLIEIQVFKNGKLKETVYPAKPSDLLNKMRSDFRAIEIVGAFSRGYSNSMAGNKQLNYQTNTTGSYSTNRGTNLYSQKEQGTISYYDQNEVNRRNQQGQYQMQNRIDNFDQQMYDFDQSLLKSNTINNNSYLIGAVYFALKTKNPDSLVISILVGKDVHRFKLE
jgi:hypothetical protein